MQKKLSGYRGWVMLGRRQGPRQIAISKIGKLGKGARELEKIAVGDLLHSLDTVSTAFIIEHTEKGLPEDAELLVHAGPRFHPRGVCFPSIMRTARKVFRENIFLGFF
ncbi:hypothetical protein GWI33_001677 [Rhynchophorus ferrugineus]|uniref:Uncharacterized protein n=1 Tax=Rhynchophorus ferrugineus TaxID=354439 RepID=A0A834IUI3_RHYFE|nr:hypothetical protein GWI33_001677 [Rhynchophorus ferrugineus]